MKKLRCGVIGLGVGRHHVEGYRSHPNAEVVALADPDEGRLKEIGDHFGLGSAGWYTDAEVMLKNEELDVVSVVTPNKFHKPLTVAAFKAGCHVLCEKPMALNAAEAKTMIAAGKKASKRLMINFSYRFTEQAWALKQQVDSGVLGDVYYASTIWHRRRGLPGFGGHFTTKALSGGGPLIDLGVHRIDLALWLMGHPQPEWVIGNTCAPIATRLSKEMKKHFDVEDFAAGHVRFANGVTMNVEASWASNRAENEFMETRLYGTQGGLVQRNLEETYKFEAELFVEQNGCQYDMKLHPPIPSPKSSMYHFIDCIVKNEPHIATGEEGLIVQELLDALYLSAEKGKPMQISKGKAAKGR